MSFLSDDLKRRAPLKVGLFYGVGALVLVLVAQMVLPVAGAPDWSVDLIAATLFIPFPVVVILTWALTAKPLEDARPVRKRREVTGGPPRD
jgi:hypothetical protein